MYVVRKSEAQVITTISTSGETTKSVAMLPSFTSSLTNYHGYNDSSSRSPATLNKFEQALMGFSNGQQSSGHGSVPSGMVNSQKLAMKTECDDEDDFSGDDSTTNEEWEPGSKVPRIPDSLTDYKVTSPSYSSTDSNGPVLARSSSGKASKRPTGPRKLRKDIQLTPEDEERRRTRRERNKQAAAKCRQKRVDLTNQLQAETETLESEQMRLQEEIKNFQREKEELELILNLHRSHCGSDTVGSLSTGSVFTSVPVNQVVNIQGSPIVISRANPTSCGSVSVRSVNSTSTPPNTNTLVSRELSGNAQTPVAFVITPVASSNGVCRPNSFPTSSLRRVAMVATSTGSNVLSFGLESMLDGHTGLTPITGMPSGASSIVGGQHMHLPVASENQNINTEANPAGLTVL